MSDKPAKRLYCYRRRAGADGRTMLLVGLEHWATDADAAMRFLKLYLGYTTEGGWYADDVTDNKKFREWAQR